MNVAQRRIFWIELTKFIWDSKSLKTLQIKFPSGNLLWRETILRISIRVLNRILWTIEYMKSWFSIWHKSWGKYFKISFILFFFFCKYATILSEKKIKSDNFQIGRKSNNPTFKIKNNFIMFLTSKISRTRTCFICLLFLASLFKCSYFVKIYFWKNEE